MKALEELLQTSPDEMSARRAALLTAGLAGAAPWLLRPQVLAKAAAYLAGDSRGEALVGGGYKRPPLPQQVGSCWVVTVVSAENRPAMRDAVVLPLQWQRVDDANGQGHDSRLPDGLRRIADLALETVAGDAREASTEKNPGRASLTVEGGWKLALAIRRFPDEAAELLCGTYDSAFASLAAGLFVAMWRGKPWPNIWCSGAWGVGGVHPVDGLARKIALAAEWGATCFFVPESQLQEARQSVAAQGLAGRLEIAPLKIAQPKLREALADYLWRLEVPPTLQDPKERRQEYFLRIPDEGEAQKYYGRAILPDVRKAKDGEAVAALGATHLVSIVSKGFWLVDLAAGVVAPQKCLLLYNRQMRDEAQMIQNRLATGVEIGGQRLECQLCEFTGQRRDEMVKEFRQAIDNFLGDQPPSKLVVDLTAGQRIMNLALYDAAPPGCHFLCVQTTTDYKSRRPVPFAEVFHLWQRETGR